MLEYLWNIKIQVVPIILAFMIFIIPSILHRLKKIYYVPIYFSVFPFNIINKSLSTYLVDEYLGEDMTNEQAEKYRTKVIVTTAISLVISIIIIPSITGFFCTFFLLESSLFHFLTILCMYLLFITIKSIINFKYYSIASKENTILLALVYFFYIGMVIYIIYNSYYWVFQYTNSGNWIGLLSNSAKFIFGTIGIKGILIVIVNGAFSIKIFDRKIRKNNIEEIKSWSDK